MFPGWINIDAINDPGLWAYAKAKNCEFFSMDLSKGVPLADNNVDFIFCSHMVEHLPYRVAEHFMKECCRVLKPGGLMRIAVPDLDIIVRLYKENRLKELDKINEPCSRAKYDTERFWEILTAGHHATYDFTSMLSLCAQAGFSKTERKSFEEGHPVFIAETQDMYPEISLYVECTK